MSNQTPEQKMIRLVPKLNPREAPRGYRAKLSPNARLCTGCAAEGNARLCDELNAQVSCVRNGRKDKCEATFVSIRDKATERKAFKRWFAQHGDPVTERGIMLESAEELADRTWEAACKYMRRRLHE